MLRCVDSAEDLEDDGSSSTKTMVVVGFDGSGGSMADQLIVAPRAVNGGKVYCQPNESEPDGTTTRAKARGNGSWTWLRGGETGSPSGKRANGD
jgi:hypothetical protein